MQCAIDNAKRTFDIDINEEIDIIKKDMDININGYPIFWKSIKRKNDKRNGLKVNELTDEQIRRRESVYNDEIKCPMNSLYSMNLNRKVPYTITYPIDKFFNYYEINLSKRRSKKIVELIEKYSIRLNKYNVANEIDDNENNEDYLLLRSDFDELIDDIKQINLSNKYLGLMSYLINQAFIIDEKTKINKDKIKHNLNKNKVLLLKILFEINPKQFLKCFSKNINN